MPVLQNARHERFAQEIAKGRTQAEAYELAGYKPSATTPQAASRLLSNVKVAARVEELQLRGADKAVVTIETISKKLEAAFSMADSTANAAAMTGAAMAQAKLFGLDIDRKQIDADISFAWKS